MTSNFRKKFSEETRSETHQNCEPSTVEGKPWKMTEDRILRGAPILDLPSSSVAHYFLPRIKSLPRDRVILVDGETGESYTVWKYLTESLRLVEGMKSLGVREGHVAAMLVRNSFEANEIMLACWLASVAVAPMNGFMKIPELKHSFKIINPKIIFCENVIVDNVAAAAEDLTTMPVIVVVDSGKDSKYTYIKYEELKQETDVDAFEPQAIESPETKVIVISPSSGTSGFPKSIGLTQRSIIFIDKSIECIGIFTRDSDFLQVSHFFWVTGVIALIRSLSTGIKRIFVKNVNPNAVLKTIDRHKPKCSLMAPLFWLSVTKFPEFRSYDSSSLKYLVLGGSPLTPSIYEGIKRQCPNLKLYEIYGLTEAGGMVSYTEENELNNVKICAGIEVKVMDLNTGEPLGPNVPGEICVRSPGMMKCYLGNEKETKESIDDDGWLHSGDIGYHDELKNLHFVERMKEMIKVKGMQVAPAEVENVIATMPGVKEVAVVGIPHETDESRPAALVVKHENAKITEEDIHSSVDASLSEYKRLVGGIYFVDNIPKTETGKVNRNLLRAMAEKLYLKSN